MAAQRGGRATAKRSAGARGAEPIARTPLLSRTSFLRHRPFITLTMNDFFLRHLGRLYREFNGDLALALVLGEIAHHNLAGVVAAHGYETERIRSAVQAGTRPGGLLPTNAFSISQATGIPRETVRRKIATLVRRGWLARSPEGYHLTPIVGAHFDELNYKVVTDLLETAAAIAGHDESTPPEPA